MSETKYEAAIRRLSNIIQSYKADVDNMFRENEVYDADVHDAVSLQLDQQRLETLYPKYNQVRSELLAIMSRDDANAYHATLREFETAFKKAMVAIRRHLKQHHHEAPEPPLPAPQNLKLPEIRLPTFNGDYDQWVGFREKFKSLVGNNSSLSEAQKLQYLQSVLDKDATLVQSDNDTYESLWEALTARYENDKIIVDRHISELLNLRTIHRESANDLRNLIETLVKNLRVLRTMNLERNDLADQILITLVSNRLDRDTRKAYELQLSSDGLPKFDDMLKFLQKRCHTLEAIANTKKITDKPTNPGYPRRPGAQKTTVLAIKSENTSPKCPNCSKSHFISQCLGFVNLSPEKRVAMIKDLKLCFNCFSGKHSADECKRGLCRECNRKHNTLLYLGKDVKKDEGGPSTSTLAVTLESHVTSGQQVLVSTAVINVFDIAGSKVYCRAFLDSCSQSNFMTEQLAQMLRIKRTPINISLGGVLGMTGSIKRKAVAKIQSRTSDYAAELEFLVVPRIASGQNDVKFSKRKWNIPKHIELADPYFATPHRLDMLLGAEIFFDLWTSHNLKLESGLPPLRGSVFGWVVAGKVPLVQDQPSAAATFCALVSTEDALLQQVKRFWELENCQRPSVWSIEEKQVEQHFLDTHQRLPDGRYVVKLPTKPSVDKLGDSKQMALNRFYSLERRFARDRDLREQYGKFINEYESLGHMQPSTVNLSQPRYDATTYFMPHHAVLKPDAVSTKLRVVFDASACSTSGLSLNDVLKVGATNQQELFEILTRFRKHRIAFTSDITKMYRQVLVNQADRPLQQILWRESPSDPVRAFSLNTVTYGTASAPFLATRALRQLALDEVQDFPDAAKVTLTDFYVDDCLSGADSIQEAIKLKHELTALLLRGGFPLHKWSANASELLDDVTEGGQTVNLSKYETTKTLGLKWHTSSDTFIITVDQSKFLAGAATKRTVLSDIARLFDPLGLVSPIVVTAKIFLQALWSQNLEWDTPLNAEHNDAWQNFLNQLREIQQITVPRRVIPFATVQATKLVGFCDASEVAYGCCLYILCVDDGGRRAARLLCSKSRIAPVKTITLPRLELCGAALLAELIAKTR